MKRIIPTALAMLCLLGAACSIATNEMEKTKMNGISQDTRVFQINPDIEARDVQFKNRFGIMLAGHLYLPKDYDASRKYPAIALSGPFGAVKEQVSGLYAQALASADTPAKCLVCKGMIHSFIDFPDLESPNISLITWAGSGSISSSSSLTLT